MARQSLGAMKFAGVYPLYVQKAERKSRTKAEVDQIIGWLTGYDQAGLEKQIDLGVDFETFFAQAPVFNPKSSLITGVVCGIRVEEIEDPLIKKVRLLDKLIDELAKGKAMEKNLKAMILPKVRDTRFITLRRGGGLTDADHQLLALWAADCAEHVLPLFEQVMPSDPRPRDAIEQVRAWVRGETAMMDSRAAGGHAMAAARVLRGAARFAAFAAGQAAAVPHVAAHELGAAAYAIKAVHAAALKGEGVTLGHLECQWQREQLPEAIRALVLDDQRLRNEICWRVFDC